jgi:hypothetical protein
MTLFDHLNLKPAEPLPPTPVETHFVKTAPPGFEPLTREQFAAAVESDTCPGCGGDKQPGHTFCTGCYFHRLPVKLAVAVSDAGHQSPADHHHLTDEARKYLQSLANRKAVQS